MKYVFVDTVLDILIVSETNVKDVVRVQAFVCYLENEIESRLLHDYDNYYVRNSFSFVTHSIRDCIIINVIIPEYPTFTRFGEIS